MRVLSSFVGALLLAACGGGDGGRPNVVLITMDTTRADYLSCYGFRGFEGLQTTPNLDRLAAEGTRFDLAMSTAAVTPVSHASILTGRFNRDHGVRVIFAGSGFRLAPDVPTLATEFKRAGYTTLAVHSAFPVSPYFGFDQGFDVMDSFDAEMQVEDEGAKAEWDQRNTRRSDETIDRVMRAVDGARDPFFLWIHLWDPHDSIQLPEARFMPPDELLYETDAQGKFVLDPDGTRRQKRPMTALYAAEILYMDHQIGRLLEHLREAGRYDDTLLAVTSDHGQGLGDHDWAAHRILYQEQIRVPLIVRVPGAVQQAVVKDLVRTVDIAPTLLDYAGLRALESVSGRTLRPLIEGLGDEPRLAFADQINGFDLNAHMVAKRPQDDFAYCAMDRQWKLTWRPNHPQLSELYQLEQDPTEKQNLWRWDHPEALRLKRELAELEPWVTEPFPAEGDGASAAAAARRLAALGYTDEGGGEEALGTLEWEYVCPEHYEERSATLGPCALCSSKMILIARGK